MAKVMEEGYNAYLPDDYTKRLNEELDLGLSEKELKTILHGMRSYKVDILTELNRLRLNLDDSYITAEKEFIDVKGIIDCLENELEALYASN